jgi:hypothetical protein
VFHFAVLEEFFKARLEIYEKRKVDAISVFPLD